jgi:hypothetical protein
MSAAAVRIVDDVEPHPVGLFAHDVRGSTLQVDGAPFRVGAALEEPERVVRKA